jgi:hypothetical protein
MINFLQGTGIAILQTLIQILVCFVGAGVLGLIVKLFKKTGIDVDDATLNQIKDKIQTIVAATNQTIVNEMKAANCDGKLTADQQRTIYNQVKNAVYACLTADQINYIINEYIDIDNGLKQLIESTVNAEHSSSLISSEILSTDDTVTIDEDGSSDDEDPDEVV